MKKLLLVACVLSCTLLAKSKKDWTQYVNPLMGSQSTFELSTGNTYPTIARPWGMNFWTPQTGKMGDGWQYVYTANKIRGFKQTHQPSPWINDYGQFSIMPMVGKPGVRRRKRASWFRTQRRSCNSLLLQGVSGRIRYCHRDGSPTERAVLFRFTFPENASFILQSMHLTKVLLFRLSQKRTRLSATVHAIAAEFPKTSRTILSLSSTSPFTYKATVENGNLQENAAEQTTNHAGAIIGFKTRKGEQVHARIASSFISFEQAAANMNELGKRQPGATRPKRKMHGGIRCWDKIEVEGGNLDQYRTFYSCLYRSLLFPAQIL